MEGREKKRKGQENEKPKNTALNPGLDSLGLRSISLKDKVGRRKLLQRPDHRRAAAAEVITTTTRINNSEAQTVDCYWASVSTNNIIIIILTGDDGSPELAKP